VASIWSKIFLSRYTNYKAPIHLNNLFNPNMNNLMAIDFANKEIADSDGILPSWSEEFPRISSNFKSKTDEKPWGENSNPIYFD
jgi:hypothetical protein